MVNSNGKTPSFIQALVTPGPGSQASRKSWSIELETWQGFFTATNTMGDTNISPETLGAPLRLATDSDGMVRYTKNGRPSMRVAPELSQQIKVVRENFAASLVHYTGTVMEEQSDAYAAQVERNQQAAAPLMESDAKLLQDDMDRNAALLKQLEDCEETAPEAAAEEPAPTTGRKSKSAEAPAETEAVTA